MGRVVQPLIVRLSKFANAVDIKTAMYHTEVEDAVQYLLSRNHGPVKDYYGDAGPYNWEEGDWKGGARNYIVAHGDHGGVGETVNDFAEGLKARGLKSGQRVKFIACSIASKVGNNPIFAQALKAKLKEIGVEVEIVAADKYVKYSTKGKLIYQNSGGFYNEERDEKIAMMGDKVERKLALVMYDLVKRSYDLDNDHLYEAPGLEPLKNQFSSKGIKAPQFMAIKGQRTLREANENYLKALGTLLNGYDRGGAMRKLMAFFDSPKALGVRAEFEHARAAMHAGAMEIWHFQAEAEIGDYRKFRPEIFEAIPTGKHRAPRDVPSWEWSTF